MKEINTGSQTTWKAAQALLTRTWLEMDPMYFFLRKVFLGTMAIVSAVCLITLRDLDYNSAYCILYALSLLVSMSSPLSGNRFLYNACGFLACTLFILLCDATTGFLPVQGAINILIAAAIIFFGIQGMDPYVRSLPLLASTILCASRPIPFTLLPDVISILILASTTYIFLSIKTVAQPEELFMHLTYIINKSVLSIPRYLQNKYSFTVIWTARDVVKDKYLDFCRRYDAIFITDLWRDYTRLICSATRVLITLCAYELLLPKDSSNLLCQVIDELEKVETHDNIKFSDSMKNVNLAITNFRKCLNNKTDNTEYDALFLLYTLKSHLIEIHRLEQSYEQL